MTAGADTITQRVDRGAALLDEKLLPGWVDRIDLDRLELFSPCRCILGQEFAGAVEDDANQSGFSVGVNTLLGVAADQDDCADYGFDVYEAEPPDGGYDALTAEWRRVILARRVEAGVR